MSEEAETYYTRDWSANVQNDPSSSHENRDQISKGDDLDLMGWFDGIISVQMFYYGIIEINRGVQNIRRENEQEGDFSSKLYEKEKTVAV